MLPQLNFQMRKMFLQRQWILICTFQAQLAPVKSADDVEAVMDALLRNRKIAAATHNIMAYRISMPIKNTVVVVSRWYGGIQLGPDRFMHINNAARSLLGLCGYIAGVNSSGNPLELKDLE